MPEGAFIVYSDNKVMTQHKEGYIDIHGRNDIINDNYTVSLFHSLPHLLYVCVCIDYGTNINIFVLYTFWCCQLNGVIKIKQRTLTNMEVLP
jgi:hypothetical protein